MSTPYVGQIKMFAGNFAPVGWALCDGSLLTVQGNDALFSLLGTTYGGDGRTTFGLPDLRGRIPIHYGQGAGLTNRPLGQKSGAENFTLTEAQLPAHNHGAIKALEEAATSLSPTGNITAQDVSTRFYRDLANPQALSANALSTASGGGNNVSNLMPFQCINFIIALVGNYPSRT